MQESLSTAMVNVSYACVWLALALYAVTRAADRPRIGRAASVVTGLGWVVLTAALIARGLAAGHWPLTTRFEFALCFAWAILGVYLLLELRWRERAGGAFVMAAALLVMTFALLRPEEEKAIRPLLPALRSIWLQFHVVTAAIGYGACGVAAGLAAAQLADKGSLPLERQARRVIGWGFPWLTAALVTGAIWAQDAWGRYWGWDPKETWSLITWLWYLLLLHSRELRGWRGRRMAWLILAGFGIILFAFAGLPWLLRTVRMTSLHGF
jgi:ABC-type transport system involved in cytochrome c biogenesis permease subunit